ncbi:MAG: hypothetical protein P9L98_00465 [Candidatus Kaelpia imicola]|nr:hypothetical protein [Candidatus Kaelpia imicola]
MKYFKGIILFIIGVGLTLSSPADARRIKEETDFNRIPENIRELSETLAKIEELFPRIKFQKEPAFDSGNLHLLLKAMREHNIKPSFILDFYRIIEEVEDLASNRFNKEIKTDGILFRFKGANAGAAIVKLNQADLFWHEGITPDLFTDKDYVSILSFDLDNLFEIYEEMGDDYILAAKTMIAHELGHNLSELPIATYEEQLITLQQGFYSEYIGLIQFDFAPYQNNFPLDVLLGRFHEVLADAIAYQIVGDSLRSCWTMIDDRAVEYMRKNGLTESAKVVFDAWRIAKSIFLGFNDQATTLNIQVEELLRSIDHYNELSTFRDLVFDFTEYYQMWGVSIGQ